MSSAKWNHACDRLSTALKARGLRLSHCPANLTDNGPVARAENLRRLLFPWGVYKVSESAPNMPRFGEIVGEYRGVKVYGSYLVERAFTDEELLRALRTAHTVDEIAELFQTSHRTAYKHAVRLLAEGRLQRRRRPGQGGPIEYVVVGCGAAARL